MASREHVDLAAVAMRHSNEAQNTYVRLLRETKVHYKTHYCGDLRKGDSGQEVLLAGWVHRRRDHGRLIFVDLRDTRGLVQIVFNPKTAPQAHAVAEQVRNEYVLCVRGTVSLRPAGTENASLPSGEVEVVAKEAEILNTAKTPPFYINEEVEVDELLRLRYRYLDLRRMTVHDRFSMRHRVNKYIRDFLDAHGFYEIETPILTKSTPEGARDYLVPSRVYPGNFYALPQSPQQLKQLLMIAGFEKYYQIARCFRDEDFRADRQAEFTQLDLEMSFIDQKDILDLIEELYAGMVRQLRPDLKLAPVPFPRLSYDDVMRRYGTDKPDIRYGMELADVTDLGPTCDFAVFRDVIAAGGQIRGFAAPGGAVLTRREIDSLTQFVEDQGGKGLISVALLGEGGIDDLTAEDVRSPMHRYLSMELIKGLARRSGAKRGDLLILVADESKVASAALDALRREMAARLNLADPQVAACCFVVDFPLFEWSESEQRWDSVHHPFTAPMDEDLPLLETDPGKARSKAYDFVVNGMECAGGSIRIHRREVQEKVFDLLGIEREEARYRFGHMLEAFEYGAPPHGGIAAGLDRTVAFFTGAPNIREVIAFPKTQSAYDPMMGAPSPVSPKQLDELGIAVTKATEVIASVEGAPPPGLQ
jgi:aspartyl-tRNA synthetase